MSNQENSKYPTSDKKPSNIFINSLRGGGSSDVFCNCGRQHYAPGNLRDSDDEDDYPSMVRSCEEEKAENPEGVIIDYENDVVCYSEFDGRVFVDGCPCNGLTRYEDWIWNNRQILRDYLKERVEQEHDWAQQELTLNKLAGISK